MTKIEINNKYWVMRSMPEGSNFSECFELKTENYVELPKGSILTKNIYLSVDAGTRMIMTDREDSYLPPTPIGEKITGTVLSEVVESENPNYLPGQ